ncbi:MAG TPA: CDP-alcohol phosphatidyltransferase family protein [Aestuariivirga sp.]|nr:CDP-alcohol phosphatidyltransferase family protein [Aestuariivirga sp.]
MPTKARAKPAKKSPVKKLQGKPVPEVATKPKAAEPKAAIHFNPVLCIVNAQEQKLWSLSLAERLRKQFAIAGLALTVREEEAITHNGPVILVRGDAVIDQPLIPVLLKRPNFLLLGDAAENPMPIAASVRGSDVSLAIEVLRGTKPFAAAKLLARAPAQLDMEFWKSLRKRETPYAMVVTAENRSAVEWRMFMGTYKGATDVITKHLWPVPAFHATRFLAPRGVTPNMVTAIAALMTVLAFWFFLNGQFIPGLLAAWTMTFLDTVDGKLARTTLTSSKWGDYFDHGIDLIHPPFWYVAWGYGLRATGTQWSNEVFWSLMAAILGGYILQRAIEGIAIKWLGLEIHIWRSIDTFFRQITARRNPNLILLTLFTAIAKPDWGLLAVAAWTVICVGLHVLQLLQAFAAKRSSGPLTSWMTRP